MTALAIAPRLSAQHGSRLRITKRGRTVLAVLVIVPLLAGVFLFVVNGGTAVATSDSGSTSFEYMTVEGGQTLWQLATEIAPKADPREVVSDIVHLNGLANSDVQAGQRLAIPAAYAK
ncbi:hypothetical protein BH09ACT6_BH09ACT6_18010 [soil metagenome]